ncbi:AraC-like DNA-binding protein [Paenibacillus baekrokdamisoli]|nr:AraC-like DNA-binding protein [Paenibacillus baekrokdamisoli]
MKAGDVFLIPGNTIHRAFPESIDPVTSTALFFMPIMLQHFDLGDAYSNLRCFEHAKKIKSYKLEIQEQERIRIEKLLEVINDEQKQQFLGYRQAVIYHLQQLLLVLNRLIIPEPTRNKGDSSVEPRWMRKILNYIDLHLDGELSLSALSQNVSISPAHFSRVFKQLTAMNVTDYVTAKRIVFAKELLLQTDDNISYIAEKSGFESLPHFYRMFKKATGITPARYKQLQRND